MRVSYCLIAAKMIFSSWRYLMAWFSMVKNLERSSEEALKMFLVMSSISAYDHIIIRSERIRKSKPRGGEGGGGGKGGTRRRGRRRWRRRWEYLGASSSRNPGGEIVFLLEDGLLGDAKTSRLDGIVPLDLRKPSTGRSERTKGEEKENGNEK